MTNEQKNFYNALLSRIGDHTYKIPVAQLQEHWSTKFRDTLCNDFPIRASLHYKPLTNPPIEGETMRIKKMFINMLLR